MDGSSNVYVTGQTASSDFPVLNTYDNSLGGDDAFVTKLSTGIQMPSGPVTVAVDTAFGAPGDTLRIAATMTNPTTDPVGGLQSSVIAGDTTEAHFVRIENTTTHPGFSVSSNTLGGSTNLVVFSSSGAVIAPGTDILLATLVYWLDSSATPGSAIPLTASWRATKRR